MNAEEFRLDYFQIYDLENPFNIVRNISCELQSQFDEKPVKVRLGVLGRFADRVSKNGEPLFNKLSHLTGYGVRQPSEPFKRRHVIVSNQFYPKEQELVIYQLVSVLAPAQKRIGTQNFFTKKTELDHYKVYRVVEGPPVDFPPIKLDDQFGGRETRVFEPRFLAVPAAKWYAEQEFKVINKDAHLLIYRIGPSRDLPVEIAVRDQFLTRRGLKLGMSYLLAVPTKKIKWWEG